MISMSTIIERLREEILSWPYVTAKAHKFGGIEFLLNKREMGHIHNEGLADIPFPMKIRDELVNSGRVKSHHVLPDSGWISYWFHNNEEENASTVIQLFRMRYEQLKPKVQIQNHTTGIPKNN